MFYRLGRLIVRAPLLVVSLWLLAGVGCLLLAPSLTVVGKSDESSFLPRSVESIEAREVLARAFPSEAASGAATLVLVRESGLTDADRTYLAELAAWMTGSDAPPEVSRVVTRVVTAEANPSLEGMLRSTDGTTELATVNLSVAPFQTTSNDAVAGIRGRIAATVPAGLDAHVTGAAGVGADYLKAIVAGTDRTTIVTVILVVLILLAIYRAPLAALVPLLTIGAAFLVGRGALGWLAVAGWQISSLLDSFIIVLVFGVGTDYTIFLISRYREELARLGHGSANDLESRRAAATATVGRIGAVITASAATVVVGLCSMAVASFGMIQTTGPALALAIVITLAAGLTLAPALLVLFGPALFWPRHPKPLTEDTGTGIWDRIAATIVRRPFLVSVAVVAGLAVPIVLLPGVSTNFDMLAELPKTADARLGFEAVAGHMDRGRLQPITVLVDAPGSDLTTSAGLAGIARATELLEKMQGVSSVRSIVAPTGEELANDLRPSARLEQISTGVGQLAQPGVLGLALLNPTTLAQLRSGGAWIAALGPAFPWLADNGDYALATTLAQGLSDSLATLTGTPAPSAEDAAKAREAAIASASGLAGATGRLATTFAARPDEDWFLPRGLAGDAGTGIEQLIAGYISPDGSIARLYVIAADDPYSTAALQTARSARVELASVRDAFGSGARIYVGGSIAETADIQTTIEGDFNAVGVITVIGVLIVLAVLLRSVVAPLFLVGTVLLSYLTTLHLAGGLFQGLLGQAGATYFLPLLVFVLLVALGSDYNIFVMSRIREESAGRAVLQGIRIASARTGTVVTSAGFILAGTFAALTTAPLQVLFQVGAAVALGVLLDTLVVRSLLVPAITAVLGEWSWWPFHRRDRPASGPPAIEGGETSASGA